jgi:hypothetical protein
VQQTSSESEIYYTETLPNGEEVEYVKPRLREVDGRVIYYLKEDIVKIPIIKAFGWKLTPKEEEEIINTGRLLMGNVNALRNGL